ncbi:MAG: nucleotidyltransferase family protein [Candidatus Marinimicrobia bacterium]|nr:nucleotidyltransferase family protein [Candidatus Neomarinimicrobiota bacterium]
MNRESILITISELKPEILRKYKAEIKGIFGSYARGEANEDSDLDVLVHFQKNATLLDLAGLGEFLESKLGCKVDVLSQRAMRAETVPFIMEDLIPV